MDRSSHNRVLVAKLAVVTAAMFGFGYLLVPFYYKLCEVAGLNQLQTADVLQSRHVERRLRRSLRNHRPATAA